MEEKIKELEKENRIHQKELKQLYPQLETALKRQRWYRNNKQIFTINLDDEYNGLVDKILNQINYIEQSIEINFININKIKSDRQYLLDKIEKQKVYNSKYWDKVRSKKLYEKEYQKYKNSNKLFNYDDKKEIIKNILHKKFDGILFADNPKTVYIDRDTNHIIEL